MNLKLLTSDRKTGRAAESRLRDSGHRPTLTIRDGIAANRLLLPADVDFAQAKSLARDLAPLPLTVSFDSTLSDPVVELAAVTFARETRIQVAGPRGDLVRSIARPLRELTAHCTETLRETAKLNRIVHRGMPANQVAFLQWLVGVSGEPVHVAQRRDTGDDGDHADITLAAQPVAWEMPGIVLHCDQPQAAAVLANRLLLEGFAEVQVVGLPSGRAADRFVLSPPTALAAECQQAWGICAVQVAGALAMAGVDTATMPLQPASAAIGWPHSTSSHQIHVSLPLGRFAAGALLPWAGDSSLRFAWVVRCAHLATQTIAVAALQQAGYRARSEAAPSARVRPPASRARAGEAADCPRAILAAFAAVHEACPDVVAAADGAVAIVRDDTLAEVVYLDLELPAEPADLISRAAANMRGNSLQLSASRSSVSAALLRPMLAAGFGHRVAQAAADLPCDKTAVLHGGGNALAAEQLAAAISRVLGEEVNAEQVARLDEAEVIVAVSDQAPQACTVGDPFAVWAPAALTGAFLAIGTTSVRIGHVELPKRSGPRHPLAPPADLIDSICLDAPTRDLLAAVAKAAVACEPLLIEGPTSATKTSAILLLASLLGQPVIRVNLSAQTDCAELVGQFVPQAGGGFAWQDGAAVRAACEGWWLVLDEVNLAPPQVIERLNPLLESRPTLTLTEHDHRVIGSAQCPLHRDFRVFGTMNPADYAGRSTMSAAGKDRWLHQHSAAAPDSECLAQLLVHAAFGAQPVVGPWDEALCGWQALRSPPFADASPSLRAQLDDFFDRVAQLQGRALVPPDSDACPAIGAERREPYTFTRRGLLALVRRLTLELDAGVPASEAMRAALRQSFVDRVAASDRAGLAVLMDAFGIGPASWKVTGGAVGNDWQAPLAEAA